MIFLLAVVGLPVLYVLFLLAATVFRGPGERRKK